MLPGVFKTVESIWQEWGKEYPLVAALIILVISQAIIALLQEARSYSQRRHERNRQRWNDLRDAYQKCLHELSIARRVPTEREDLHGNPGIWLESNSFNGAMAGLLPLLAQLTILETYSYRCGREIKEARIFLRNVLDTALAQPEQTIRKGPGSPEDSRMKVRADCGLAQMVDELIDIVSHCAQKDLEWSPD